MMIIEKVIMKFDMNRKTALGPTSTVSHRKTNTRGTNTSKLTAVRVAQETSPEFPTPISKVDTPWMYVMSLVRIAGPAGFRPAAATSSRIDTWCATTRSLEWICIWENRPTQTNRFSMMDDEVAMAKRAVAAASRSG